MRVRLVGGCSAEWAPPGLASMGSWQHNRGSNLDKWDQGEDIKQVSSLQTCSAFDVHAENGISILFRQPGQSDNFY